LQPLVLAFLEPLRARVFLEQLPDLMLALLPSWDPVFLVLPLALLLPELPLGSDLD
jgi:hypothetical protein